MPRHGSRQPTPRAFDRRRHGYSGDLGRPARGCACCAGCAALGSDDERARRPAADGRDEGNPTDARAPRPDPPRRDRWSHPVRLQHREPDPAAGADDRAAERRPGRRPSAAPDLDRPGGRTGAPPPVGRAGRERDRAREVERSAHPQSGAPRRPLACGPAGVTVDLAPVADVPGPGSFMAADDRTFGASGAVVGRAATAFVHAGSPMRGSPRPRSTSRGSAGPRATRTPRSSRSARAAVPSRAIWRRSAPRSVPACRSS